MFQGIMAGIVYNGLRPLDLANDKSERTKIRGDIRALTSIPYDYKDKNPGLFMETGVQSPAELYSHDGSGTIRYSTVQYTAYVLYNTVRYDTVLGDPEDHKGATT